MRLLIHYVRRFTGVALAFVCLLAMTGTAGAQAAAPATGEWTRGSTLNLFGGLAADGSRAAIAAGGGIGWEVTPQFAIEGTAAWFDRGRSAEAFSADLTALASLVPPRRVVPFVKAGGGVYLTWFNTAESPIPDFYSDRIEPQPLVTTASFTDGAVVMGGGVKIWLSENVALRPEVDAKLVIRGSRTYWLSAAVIRLAYFFEDRPTTDRGPGTFPGRTP